MPLGGRRNGLDLGAILALETRRLSLDVNNNGRALLLNAGRTTCSGGSGGALTGTATGDVQLFTRIFGHVV